jgi:hypothetical protein
MRKANARAKLPPVRDAALFALVRQSLEIEARHKASQDRVSVAEDERNVPATPREVLRTEKDLRLNLFVGSPLGCPYDKDEIKALRVFCRTQGRAEMECRTDIEAYTRAMEILRAWAPWRENVHWEEKRSGYAKAAAEDWAIADEHDAILSQIALTRPTTIEGLFAKAKAARWVMPGKGDAEFAKALDDQLAKSLQEFGPDEDAMRTSLARDLIDLALRGA